MPKEIDNLSGPNQLRRGNWGGLTEKKYTRGYAEKNGAKRFNPENYENGPVRHYSEEELKEYEREQATAVTSDPAGSSGLCDRGTDVLRIGCGGPVDQE